MLTMIVALGIWAAPPAAPQQLPSAPYVSCQDGHIARTLSECPTVHHTKPHQPVPYSGGGRGLLGLGIGGIL
jgi:hypothetical protein